jgi:NACHT domain
LVLGLAQGFAECFDMMVEAMREIGTMLECYHIFSRTYDSTDAMRMVLVESYKNILIFWQKAAKLFTRNGVRTFFKGIVKPFDSEWRTLKSRLELDVRQVSIFAQALEGSAAKRREDEAKQRETHEDEVALQTRRERMRVWLSGFDETAQIDVRMDLEALQKARHIGTCEWIFEDPEYQKWLTSCENENLWLHANPGTGKSVLCSSIIQQLRANDKKVAFFFCSFQEPLKRKITCALKSLALQLFGFYEDLPSDLERIYEYEIRHGPAKLQNPTVIVVVLQVLLKSLERVHIIVDGLDECEDRELTVNLLSECFRTSSLGIVKWLWSSRIEPHFQDLAAVAKAKFVQIQKAQVEDDIKTFVEDSPEMAGSSHRSVEEWVAASEGNFLWLTLMLRTLTGCDLTCPAEVEEELGRFPKGLKQCYQRVLDNLMKRSKSQQQLARCVEYLLIVPEFTDVLVGDFFFLSPLPNSL